MKAKPIKPAPKKMSSESKEKMMKTKLKNAAEKMLFAQRSQ